MFYLEQFLGSVDLTVTWRDRQSRRLKIKTKTFTAGTYTQSSSGGWSSPGYEFNQNLVTAVLSWGDTDVFTMAQNPQKQDYMVPVRMSNVVTNELQATVAINLNNSAVTVRSISFEGQPLGVSPDVG